MGWISKIIIMQRFPKKLSGVQKLRKKLLILYRKITSR